VPSICGFYPGICLTTEEKHRKTSVRVETSVRVDDYNLKIQRFTCLSVGWVINPAADCISSYI